MNNDSLIDLLRIYRDHRYKHQYNLKRAYNKKVIEDYNNIFKCLRLLCECNGHPRWHSPTYYGHECYAEILYVAELCDLHKKVVNSLLDIS